jgi:UMP-CMP kinase family protein
MSKRVLPDEYLKKHHLTEVIDEVVKKLLDKQPEDPLQFMIDNLTHWKSKGFTPSQAARCWFVLGPPGSGKGTQSAKLVQDFGFIHISAGDLLREERKKDSEEGKMIAASIDHGLIVPGHVTIRLLKKRIESFDTNTKFLIDGFPREMGQAVDFEREITKCQCVLFFECPLEIVESRLLERGKTSGRTDDTAEVIIKRFKTYVDQTKPVIDYFSAQNKVARVDTSGDIDSAYEQVKKVLGLKQ